ncbi:MAG: hypothetical protein FWF08_06165 [Oscillospiraceae bacterium]|nr:hypothetical protein [Oscillospiraceae bacterium]
MKKEKYLMVTDKKTELVKGVLLVASGYVFCYMFMLDYSIEGMNVFARNSTTSITFFNHPYLYMLWMTLCISAFYLNLSYMRRRYEAGQKTLAVLQYTAAFGLVGSTVIPTHVPPHETFSHYFRFYAHMGSTVVAIFSGVFCIVFLFYFKMKDDASFKIWFHGGIAFVVVFIAATVIIGVCSFLETVLVISVMAVLYAINYTDLLMPAAGRQAIKKSSGCPEEPNVLIRS